MGHSLVGWTDKLQRTHDKSADLYFRFHVDPLDDTPVQVRPADESRMERPVATRTGKHACDSSGCFVTEKVTSTMKEATDRIYLRNFKSFSRVAGRECDASINNKKERS